MSAVEPGLPLARRTTVAALLVAATALGACSSGAEKEAAVPGADKPHPGLATVPDRTPDADGPRQRMQIREGLLADRRNARYAEGGGPVAGYGKAPDRVTKDDVRAEIIRPGSARAGSEGRVRTVDGVRLVRSGFIAAVTFARNATALPPGSGRKIVRIAELQSVLQSTLTLIGRAAEGESAATARARARAVASGLETMGVAGSRIRVRTGDGPAETAGPASRVDIYMSGGRVPKR